MWTGQLAARPVLHPYLYPICLSLGLALDPILNSGTGPVT